MDSQTAKAIDMSHFFPRGKGSGYTRASTHLEPRVVKREMLEDHQFLTNVKLESPRDVLAGAEWRDRVVHQDDLKDRHRISPEVEAGGWLRDEPVDTASSCGLPRSGSGSASATLRDCAGNQGSGDMDGSLYANFSNSNSSAPVASDSPGRLPDLTEDAAVPPSHSSTLSSLQEQRSMLFAQLRGIRIRESVIMNAIERLGGGQKGLRAILKVIVFWLRERNRTASSRACDQVSGLDPLAPLSEEIEKLHWSNAGPGSMMENQFGSCGDAGHSSENGSNNSGHGDIHTLVHTAFGDGVGGFGDLKLGGGEYEEGRNYGRSLQVLNEPGTLGGVLDDLGMEELGAQVSGVSSDVSPLAAYGWNPCLLSEERQHRPGIRKLSPSPDRGLLSTPDVSYDDRQFHRNKIRRVSPPANSSSSSCDIAAYPNISQPLPDVLTFCSVGSNPFAPGGPFSLSPSSPPLDPHALDMGSFNSFGLQGTSLIDDTHSPVGGSADGCISDRLGSLSGMYPVSMDTPLDKENSGTRLGLLAKPKSTPAASTRLARKNRMDRNRKAASHHSTRAVQQTGTTCGVATGPMWPPASPASLRSMPVPQTLLAGEGQSRTKDRRDMDNLKYLLQKMLRPSDVGNLGRIVLPKKDAESHLPWLNAREGVQIKCEDFDTGENMILRYRYWPNNKSRMYLLENTGDFVKKHKLEEGDRLVIYGSIPPGTFIVRGRKARDCVDLPAHQVQADETEGKGKELSSQGSPGSANSSGASSNDMDVGTFEPVGSSADGSSDSGVTTNGMVTSQDDLLNFADLPDAPMGAGTENLVRFPSLDTFDVELLDLVPAASNQHQQQQAE